MLEMVQEAENRDRSVPRRLVILGKQGAGKGTQAGRLSEYFEIPHISTGDMLRAAARSGSRFGREAAQCMQRGDLVPDEVMVGLVRERLSQDDARAGFLLDGFPRTVGQAEAMEAIVAGGIDFAIDIEVPTEIVVKRLASRRVCEVCGSTYSLDVPPPHDWECDRCGGAVVQRKDDTPEAIRRRLELYEEQTEPLVAWYLERDQLVTVDGTGKPEEVTQRIIRALERRRAKTGQ